jgi:hypothetical protein
MTADDIYIIVIVEEIAFDRWLKLAERPKDLGLIFILYSGKTDHLRRSWAVISARSLLK